MNERDFVSFLQYCADRLEEGATVADIWAGYKATQAHEAAESQAHNQEPDKE